MYLRYAGAIAQVLVTFMGPSYRRLQLRVYEPEIKACNVALFKFLLTTRWLCRD